MRTRLGLRGGAKGAVYRAHDGVAGANLRILVDYDTRHGKLHQAIAITGGAHDLLQVGIGLYGIRVAQGKRHADGLPTHLDIAHLEAVTKAVRRHVACVEVGRKRHAVWRREGCDEREAQVVAQGLEEPVEDLLVRNLRAAIDGGNLAAALVGGDVEHVGVLLEHAVLGEGAAVAAVVAWGILHEVGAARHDEVLARLAGTVVRVALGWGLDKAVLPKDDGAAGLRAKEGAALSGIALEHVRAIGDRGALLGRERRLEVRHRELSHAGEGGPALEDDAVDAVAAAADGGPLGGNEERHARGDAGRSGKRKAALNVDCGGLVGRLDLQRLGKRLYRPAIKRGAVVCIVSAGAVHIHGSQRCGGGTGVCRSRLFGLGGRRGCLRLVALRRRRSARVLPRHRLRGRNVLVLLAR